LVTTLRIGTDFLQSVLGMLVACRRAPEKLNGVLRYLELL